MIKEIEVKAKVSDLKSLKTKLEKLGCVFSDPVVQNDEIFMREGLNFENIKLGDAVLRIRQAKGKALFTLKKTQSNQLDKIEKEVEISNADIFREALLHMDFHKEVEVHKTRVKTKYKDTEICLDEVKGLGSFIEVEKMSDGNAEEIQKELFAFLETLGVQKSEQVKLGYDWLVYLASKR